MPDSSVKTTHCRSAAKKLSRQAWRHCENWFAAWQQHVIFIDCQPVWPSALLKKLFNEPSWQNSRCKRIRKRHASAKDRPPPFSTILQKSIAVNIQRLPFHRLQWVNCPRRIHSIGKWIITNPTGLHWKVLPILGSSSRWSFWYRPVALSSRWPGKRRSRVKGLPSPSGSSLAWLACSKCVAADIPAPNRHVAVWINCHTWGVEVIGFDVV